MDGRIASLQATINGLAKRIEERFAQIDARFTQIDARFTQIDARFAQIDARFAQIDARMFNIEATVAAIRNSIGGLKTTMIVTAIGVVIGVATFNTTVLSNMLASFESGRKQSEAQAKIFRQSEETAALLRQIQRALVVPEKNRVGSIDGPKPGAASR